MKYKKQQFAFNNVLVIKVKRPAEILLNIIITGVVSGELYEQIWNHNGDHDENFMWNCFLKNK